MQLAIHKYALELTGRQDVLLPADAQLLDIQEQGGGWVLWAAVDPSLPRDTPLTVYCRGTGHPIDATNAAYFGTRQAGIFVWHWFVPAAAKVFPRVHV